MKNSKVNAICENESKIALYYFTHQKPTFSRRLRTCNAQVYAYYTGIGVIYVLKSYSTLVAMIDEKGMCYDYLRYVYGYTATSAQHISKFFKDYAPANAERLTYRA